MFRRLWDRIPVPLLDGHNIFFTYICCKNCLFEKTKVNEKEAEDGPFFKKRLTSPCLFEFQTIITSSCILPNPLDLSTGQIKDKINIENQLYKNKC